MRALAAALLVSALATSGCSGDPIPDNRRGEGLGSGGAEDADDGGGDIPPPDVDSLLDATCAQSTQKTSLLPSNVLFVVDRSLSMACSPPPSTPTERCEANPSPAPPGFPSKWDITRDALSSAIEQLPSDTTVGLSYFSNNDSCGVHSLPSVGMAPLVGAQVDALRSSLMGVEPSGATPIVGATILAYQHLHHLALTRLIRGNKFVVLLTDGDQSEECVDARRCDSKESCTRLLLDEEAPKAADTGVNIRTFVIGAPGSGGARGTLSELAVAGGTARPGCDVAEGDCHFDMSASQDFDTSLADALARIIGAATPCEIPMPAATDDAEVDRDFVNVIYSPGDGSEAALIGQDERDCDDGADGWQYVADGAKIRLCGDVCERVRTDGRARVDVVLGCKTEGPQ